MGGNLMSERLDGRARIGWWLFIVVLAIAAAYIAYSFVGMIVLGVFGYYATRPIYRRLDDHLDYDGLAAGLTLLLVIGPVFALALYAGFQVFQQVQQLFMADTGGFVELVRNYFGVGPLSNEQRRIAASILQNPRQAIDQPGQVLRTVLSVGRRIVSAVFGTLVLLALALTLSYFLLEHEDDLSDALVELFGGRDTAAYSFASMVDDDLESVFFGNLLFVLVMSVVAAVAYWGTNYFAPPELRIPMVLTLAFLTGVASLIPLVVGKVVYIPVVGYLALQAVRTGGNQLAFVGGALVAYFLLLDILPQTFVQPYITGRQLDMVMMLFAYLLGPILFGWYGFFLLPIVFIVMLEAIRVVLPELLHGERLTQGVSVGEGVGPTPRSARKDVSEPDDAESDAN